MRTTSDARLLVLHAARLRGYGDAADVARLFGLDQDMVAEQLRELADAGLVERRDGQLRGWVTTAAGRAEQERLLGAELDAAGCRDEVTSGYEQFRALNGELLGACTAWQVRDGVPNDHRDTAHDQSALARLARVHDAVVPVLEGLESCLDRFGAHRRRLDAAFARVCAGDTDWLAKPSVDSYHTVWFQLHEDLLNTLGRDRSGEADDEE